MKRPFRVGKIEFSADDKPVLLLARDSDELRPLVEGFARRIYNEKYGADLRVFSQELLALKTAEKGIISCIGINAPRSGAFFLEQYLDGPIEKEIAARCNEEVSRQDVVEVGTLAINSSGLCRLMMAGLAGVLAGRKKRYLSFTAVRTLRNTLRRIGIPYITLAPAAPERLRAGVKCWGSYYKASPEVVVVDLERCWTQVGRVLKKLKREGLEDTALLMERLFLEGVMLERSKRFERRSRTLLSA